VTVSGFGKLLSTGDRSCGLDAEGHEVHALPGCLHRRVGDHALRFASSTPGAFGIILDAASVMAVPGSK
jgi:hypothetical protein